MQTPALFQPMSLGAGFGETYSSPYGTPAYEGDVYVASDFPLNLPTSEGDVYIASDFPLNLPENVAVVNQAGDAVDKNGRPIISAAAMEKAVANNPGRGSEAVAREIQATAPDYAKQFKNADDLVKAAYALFNTSKAVVQGKPIPQGIQSPYVYNPNNPNAYRPTATTQLSANSTNMLLIGGVALVAFLALRKK